jgi:flagellar hook protein FlgE
MLDSIFIGMSGLDSFSKGIKLIGNNTANMNTPGYKGSTLQFGDLMYSGHGAAGGEDERTGTGVNSFGTYLNLKAGELRQTENAMDMAVDGGGLFVLRNTDGALRYTRAGQFDFDLDGRLINRNDQSRVQALNGEGGLSDVVLDKLRINPPAASKRVAFRGNLSSSATDQTISSVNVLDAQGASHSLTVKLTSRSPDKIGYWRVSVLDGAVEVGVGEIGFKDGAPITEASKVSITYTPAGQDTALPLVLDFSTEVTSFASGNLSTLAFASQDGFQAGTLSKTTVDATGTLVLSYSNGQTAKGQTLALMRYESPDAVLQAGDNQFEDAGRGGLRLGLAQQSGFGAVRAGFIELSNVDLSKEFSDLIIMQRGYQASSQIVSTANEMIQQLFSMRGK